MLTVIVNNAGDVLVLDPPRDAEGNVIVPEGNQVRELTDTEAAKFGQAGSYHVDVSGNVTVTPPPPPNAHEVERNAASSDFEATYQAALTRLDQIIGATSPTNAQVVAALQDEARILKRVCRLMYARPG